MKLYSTINNKDGICSSRDDLIEMLNNKEFKFEYTYGLGYKSPTINHVQKSRSEATKIIKKASLMDVYQTDNNTIHINEFDCNDMW